MKRLLLLCLILTLPVFSFAEEKKAAPKKTPAAKQKAARKQDQDWGRFNSTSKRDLDTADKKKAQAAKK